ncbi:MAG: adenylosuccinate lyase [Chitinivibrionales bacterium]|nr:adenylosuccinate lyase [Chitinivibrionales bacterium]
MANFPKSTSVYTNPLIERYSSNEMSKIFSSDYKFSTWRKLWLALAESEKDLGIPITDEQIEEMKANIFSIDYEKANDYERKMRHDVMAHVHTYGDICPKAKPIIHLGATSAFVGDNTDLIQIKEATILIIRRLRKVMEALKDFALKQQSTATLGFTHYQPAQLTTIGKRACLWLYDASMDLEELVAFVTGLPFRGAKGTTGTQASYLKLFNGNHEKVKQLDIMVAKKMGFERLIPVTGQTYTRKIDARITALLSGLAQTLHKIANDIRLLQNLKEIEEPFGTKQIGSSAMAYKRNPMRSERLTSLSRLIISLAQSPAMTAAEQWFERTLDDSANKRISIPESFLAADACCILAHDICNGLVVYPKVIEKHILQELPFMATENILMEGVQKGGNRQELHERIRVHSQEAAKKVKMEGGENDLLERIVSDPSFGITRKDLDRILKVSEFVGRAPEQIVEFIEERIEPLLQESAHFGSASAASVKV